jgi:cysteinyl-tRNA synthetase
VTPFRLYDSMRRHKVAFEPLVPGQIGMYVCGPTTYAAAHIGHAYSAIAFDTIRRSLEFLGWRVTYVRNVTDVDDKIIKAANELGENPVALSAHFADDYNRDMALFNVRPPDLEPKVSTHIPQIIALIEQLIARGHAYAVDGDVNYSVESFPAYGKLSGQTLDQLRDGARVEIDERKRAPADFALWKAAKPHEPSWPSPWGPGRPGWHIECSAMTVDHLGITFDLHGGGRDLIFPHHENEIAQSQGAAGDGTFARYWLHNGFLNTAGEKMSKSLGNVLACDTIAEAVGGEALRFFCVSHHYRSSVDFDVQATPEGVRFFSLEAADRDLSYFYDTLRKLEPFAVEPGAVLPEAEALLVATREALADDFNTPVVVAALHEAAKLANRVLDQRKGIDKQLRSRTLAHIAHDLRAVGVALGILQQAPSAYLAGRRSRLVQRKRIDVAAVEHKVSERTSARAAQDFSRADVLRGELEAMGIQVLDSPGGTEWMVAD